MSTQPSNISAQFLFGPFQFDPATGELRKRRSRIRLHGQAVQILSLLLDRAGDAVSRKELQGQLWPEAVSGDFEHGLNAAVNKLRQALGDSADQPRYVETLPGRGYRFIAPVQTPSSPVLEMARSSPVRPEPVRLEKVRRRAAMRWLPALAGLLAVVVIAVAASYWIGTKQDRRPSGLRPTQFTIAPPPGFFLEGAGNRQSFAVSPDGSQLAFTAMDDSGLFRVFIRDLQKLAPWVVPDSAGAHAVFWHPDGKSLLFTAGGKLRRVTPSAESTQVLADSLGLYAGAYLRPDRLLLSSRMSSALVPSSGGSSERLKDVYAWPQLLPDGETLLQVAFDPKLGRYRGRVSRFGDTTTARDLVETDSKVVYTKGYLLYVRAGTLLAHRFDAGSLQTEGEPFAVARGVCTFLPSAGGDFAVSNSGVLAYQQCVPRSQLAWVDRQGRQVSTASPAGLTLKAARLSPDGRRLGTSVYDVERGVTDVWQFNVDGTGGKRLVAGPGLTHSPVWSPDSKRIVFARAFETTPKLFLRSVEGNEPEEALPRADFQMPTDWSPDGRFVLYNNTGLTLVASGQQGDIWALDLDRERRLVPLVRTPFHEANGAFSPDGKWLAFTSNESGRTEVYLQRLETQAADAGDSLRVTGERHLVSRHGAQCLRWRPDGKELFYLGSDGQVYAVSMRLGPALAIGPPSKLFTIGTEARAAVHAVLGFDVSADGSRFVIPVVSSQEKPSLVVIQNWESALPGRP